MQRATILNVPRRCFRYVIAIALISAAPVGAASPQPLTKLVPDKLTNQFGHLISLDGDTALVGSRQFFGSGTDLSIYKRGSSGDWTESAILSSSRAIWSVALKSDLVLTGAAGPINADETEGEATIYRENGDGSWAAETGLVASDGGDKDRFGTSVAIDVGVAVVGAPFNGHLGTGATYVFEKGPAGHWTETAKLTASDPYGFKQFGHCVAVSGDSLLIGSISSGSIFPGSAYVFGRNESGGWEEVQKLLPSDSVINDHFGVSAALNGDTAIIGATGRQDPGSVPGAAYIFRDDGTGNWSEVAKLTVPASFGGSKFGLSVSLFGEYAVVGSPGHDDLGSGGGTDPGLAYVFKERPTGAWELEFVLAAPDGAAGDGFGRNVAISGPTIAVSAQFDDEQFSQTGSAYIFQIPEPSAAQLAMLSLVGVLRRSPKRRDAVLMRFGT